MVTETHPSTPLARSLRAGGQLCVGVDPHPGQLAQWGLPDSPQGLTEFGLEILSAAREAGVSVMKPQVALFERHGVAGMTALAEWMGHARAARMAVIADAKRGDIGTTMAGYATAWLQPGGDFEADGLTVSPYLGIGALEPAFELALVHAKTIFVLAATSNPEAQALQAARSKSGQTVAGDVLSSLETYGHQHPSVSGWLGAVVGATIDQSALGLDLEASPHVLVLAPGFGFQGASLESVGELFGAVRDRLFAAVSRSVAGASRDGLLERIHQHREELERGGL